MRESELAEAIAIADEAATEGYTAAVIGDLNMGPESSAGNYRYMSARGYDTWHATQALYPVPCGACHMTCHSDRVPCTLWCMPRGRYMSDRGYDDVVLPFAEEVGCTWDPKSPLNNLQVFAECPPQRIDHFFFKRGSKQPCLASTLPRPDLRQPAVTNCVRHPRCPDAHAHRSACDAFTGKMEASAAGKVFTDAPVSAATNGLPKTMPSPYHPILTRGMRAW